MKTQAFIIGLALAAATACTGYEGDEEEIARQEAALSTSNALTMNALTKNALTKNALTKNALTKNALTKNGLVAAGLTGTLTDPAARQVLQYIYSCAMPLGTSMSVPVQVYTSRGWMTYTYTFNGELGLAPEWGNGSCGSTCQGWVSSCVIARVNADGTPVPLSLRGTHAKLRYASSYETSTFDQREATFYGNIFAEPMEMYHCIRSVNTGYAYGDGRWCGGSALISSGDVCPIPRAFTTCAPLWQGQTHAECTTSSYGSEIFASCKGSNGKRYYQPITTFMQ